MAATRAEVLNWAAAYKRNFNGLCQALAWQLANKFGRASQGWAYGSARAAYNASKIESRDPNAAPAGAWHYFNQPGDYYHVGFALGGGEMLSATGRAGGTQIGEAYQHLKVHRVTDYNPGLGNYLGWSHTNGVNDADIVAPTAPVEGSKDEGWFTTTEYDGVPGAVFWQMLDIVRNRFYGGCSRDEAIRRLVGGVVNEQKIPGWAYTDAAEGKSRGKFYWKDVQLHGNRYVMHILRKNNFPNGLKTDGIPGAGSQLIEYHIAAWKMNQLI